MRQSKQLHWNLILSFGAMISRVLISKDEQLLRIVMPGRFLKQLMPVVYVAFVAFYILIKESEHPRTWSAALYSWGLSRLNCINGDCKLLEVMKPNAVVVSFLTCLLFTGCWLEVKGKHGTRIWIWCSCHDTERLKCLERCWSRSHWNIWNLQEHWWPRAMDPICT